MDRPRRSVAQIDHRRVLENRLEELRAVERAPRRSARLAASRSITQSVSRCSTCSSQPAITSSSNVEPNTSSTSTSPVRATVSRRSGTSNRLSCPNPLCRKSFASSDLLDEHLACGGGNCPTLVCDVAGRTCEWCHKTLVTKGNWVLHISRCRRRPEPVTAVQAVGRFNFTSVHGATAADGEGDVVLRCEHCGGNDPGITHMRECPGLAHVGVVVENDSESVATPQHRPEHDDNPETRDALLSVSFVDADIPPQSWSWLDSVDMCMLPQTHTIEHLPAWVMSATSQIVAQIITDRLTANPSDNR